MQKQRVLAIMPHPDDIEILCAGTLLRLREAGCDIHLATMTPGDKGSSELTREQIAAVRRQEAQEAAKVIGAASCACLEFADLEIVFDNDARRRVAGFLRTIDPHIVITTAPVDYMADHEITSSLVRDACFNAAVPNYTTEENARPIGRIPHLYYADSIGGRDLFGQPSRIQCVVDVTAQIETKSRALACHDSQRSWLTRQHGMDDYIDSMKRWGGERGTLAGFTYGEGFCQHLGHPHPVDNVLITLVQAATIE